MKYEIQSGKDFSAGAVLNVHFPEEMLDRKALYTIQVDQPDFLVPFRYRSIDGQAECIYHLGNRSKLQYRFGPKTLEEYITFWKQILQPLLDCGDWFLDPFSFVLDTQYLYVDKGNKTVSYLYIPTEEGCGDQGQLQQMAVDLCRQNPATVPSLENKALRAIMQDFQPGAFLQMLQQEQPKQVAVVQEWRDGREDGHFVPLAIAAGSAGFDAQPSAGPVSAVEDKVGGQKEIVIDLGSDGKREKKKEKGSGLFGGWREKKAVQKEVPKRGGLFGSKKGAGKEVMVGAAAELPDVLQREEKASQAPLWRTEDVESDETQLLTEAVGACLRLASDLPLPGQILVSIEPGQNFTIGRFDVTVGHRQSDFEFDKRTKAVSRHHAAIERDISGRYSVVDLASSAGTFVNGERLSPNVPRILERGVRVSFGTGGADYIWEE